MRQRIFASFDMEISINFLKMPIQKVRKKYVPSVNKSIESCVENVFLPLRRPGNSERIH